jgi:hypothetical protein
LFPFIGPFFVKNTPIQKSTPNIFLTSTAFCRLFHHPSRMLPMLLRRFMAAWRFRRQFAMDFEDDTKLWTIFA